MAFPTADQTRDDVAQRDGPRPSPRAPRTCLRRMIDLCQAHLSLSFERCGSPGSASSVDFVITVPLLVDLESAISFRDSAQGAYMPIASPIPPDLPSSWTSEMRASVVSIR